MVKKKIVSGCVVFGLCFFTGCANKEAAESSINVQGNNTESNLEEIPEHIDDILASGVEVEANIEMPELDTKDVSIYQGTTMKIDTKELSDVLLDEPVTQDIEKDGQGEETESLCIYSGEDGTEIISINDTWVKFSTVKFSHIRTDFESEPISDGQIDFDFISRGNADQKIREVLKPLNIEIYPESECVPMDYRTLKEKNLEQYADMEEAEEIEVFQEDINMLQSIPWSEDYNCYCFTYYGMVDGIKLNSQDRETDDNVVPGSIIRAVYAKDGIQSLEISDIYIAQKEVEKMPLCTMDTVLGAIDQKYNSIILQGNYKVTSMELVYIADVRNNNEGYTLLPVWRCIVNHKYDVQDKNSSEIANIEDNSVILIDAVSGTEVYSGGSI